MIIESSELKVGTQIAEEDGFLFDVTEIVKETSTTITVRLCSEFSSYKHHWKSNGGIVKTFNKSSLLQVIN